MIRHCIPEMTLTDYMCQEEREEGGLLAFDESIQRLEDYIEKHGRRLITATRNNTNDTRNSGTTITRKQEWQEKQFYGHFK